MVRSLLPVSEVSHTLHGRGKPFALLTMTLIVIIISLILPLICCKERAKNGKDVYKFWSQFAFTFYLRLCHSNLPVLAVRHQVFCLNSCRNLTYFLHITLQNLFRTGHITFSDFLSATQPLKFKPQLVLCCNTTAQKHEVSCSADRHCSQLYPCYLPWVL